MRADPDPDRRGDQRALVPRGIQPDPVGVLGAERPHHRPEVRQRPRGEVVALGGVQVEVVEGLELVARGVGRGDLDALLGGLLDVAPPQLVHAREHVVLGAAGQRDPEDVLRLAGGEAALDRLGPPAEVDQLGDHPRTEVGALGGWQIAEAAYGVVRDAFLDRGRVPAPGHDRRAHPDPEGAARTEVGGHRLEPLAQVVGRPVDHRALGKVGQEPLDLGQLAVKHEGGADQLVAAEPAEGLATPLRLHPTPGRGLQEARRAAAAQERQVVALGDLADAQHPGHATERRTPHSQVPVRAMAPGGPHAPPCPETGTDQVSARVSPTPGRRDHHRATGRATGRTTQGSDTSDDRHRGRAAGGSGR